MAASVLAKRAFQLALLAFGAHSDGNFDCATFGSGGPFCDKRSDLNAFYWAILVLVSSIVLVWSTKRLL